MKNGKLTLGLIASSNKENEKRVAIHPAHFRHFDDETRPYVYAEKGYGRRFLRSLPPMLSSRRIDNISCFLTEAAYACAS